MRHNIRKGVFDFFVPAFFLSTALTPPGFLAALTSIKTLTSR
jgi:hypothetical protein